MTNNSRKHELLAEKARLLERIQTCDDTFEELKYKQNYIVYSSDGSDDEIMDRRPTKVLATKSPTSYELQEKLEHLGVRMTATKELTGIHIGSYEIEMLPRPPEDLNLTEEQLECDWHSYTAKCRLGLASFNITFLLQTPKATIISPPYRHRFHRVCLSLSKRQHSLEWSRARKRYAPTSVQDSPGRSPSAEISALQGYVDCVQSRSNTLTVICDQYGNDGYVTLEPADAGGIRITGPDSIFELEWTIICSKGSKDKFINDFEMQLEQLDKEFAEEVNKIFLELCDEKNTSVMHTRILSKLIDMCLSVDGDAVNKSPIESVLLPANEVTDKHTPEHNPVSPKEDSAPVKEVREKNKKIKKSAIGKQKNRSRSVGSQDTVKIK